MAHVILRRHTHSGRLERWLGPDQVARLSDGMRSFYAPVAVGGVPGRVTAMPGGDFTGHVDAGHFGSAYDRAEDAVRRAAVHGRRRVARWAAGQLVQANAGFSSLSDLISESTSGKRREIAWQKVGATGVVAVTNSLWRLGNQPVAGATGTAAPGGRALTEATTGAQYGLDNVSADTRHFVSGRAVASVAGNTLLLYDRIFDVLKTMNSTATESVTGVPTRYQSSAVPPTSTKQKLPPA